MPVPRWFESTFLEAEENKRAVDFAHLGEQFALRIEEVLRPKELKEWWSLTGDWKEPAESLGEMEAKIVSFLEEQCTDCMGRVPDDQRGRFLKGIWKKKA